MKTYDSDQIKAIEAKDGYFLVLAPPGCGKTDILAERIACARRAGVSGDDMVCLTFTNRASRGMRNRVAERVGEEAKSIFVGNVHRFCSNFLFANAIMPENTSIIDDDDQADILMTQDEDFFRNYFGNVDRNRLNEVGNIASYIRQRQLAQPKPAIILPDAYEHYFSLAKSCQFEEGNVPPGNNLLRYALFYMAYKKERGYIDFDDILILAYEALRHDTGHAYKRYPWVQVDEVQDLNALQIAIIDELTDTSRPFTVMFLGDEQQAIFSFLGAKLGQLAALKDRCAGHLMYLGNNYRSPQYLLDVFNTYAEKELMVDRALLPHSAQHEKPGKWDLLLIHSETALDENKRISGMVRYYMQFEGERLAILVPTNDAADRISKELTDHGVANFKISGRDMFKTKAYKTLSSLFCCMANEYNAMAWVRLLYGIGAFRTQADARAFVARMRKLMMTPMDLLRDGSYLERFCRLYESEEMVYFDTETTGLDVEVDDIVQIAAFKVQGGRKVEGSDFVVFLHTDRAIPKKLGDLDNPLIEAYAGNKHCARAEGLRMFLDYIGDDAVLGHNVMYDYSILQHNVAATLHESVTLDVYDSLRLAKSVEPFLRRYKLDYLIHALHLEGKNSHLANEDVAATKMLVDYCYKKARPVVPQQQQLLAMPKLKPVRARMEQIRPLFEKVEAHLRLAAGPARTLADELRDTYDDMLSMKLIEPLGPKFDIFLSYIRSEWTVPDDGGESLADQLHAHVNDMASAISEGDLVNSTELIRDRVFVMTVHKGKGLEFENVVILGANDGTYPFYKNTKALASPYTTEGQKEDARKQIREDARKFYVALSRARKRLCVSYTSVNSYGSRTRMTPFMNSIQQFFYTGRNQSGGLL